jgi:hypothetical protein
LRDLLFQGAFRLPFDKLRMSGSKVPPIFRFLFFRSASEKTKEEGKYRSAEGYDGVKKPQRVSR